MVKAVTDKRQAGDKYEDEAIHFLTRHGLTLLCRNYLCKAGEIDLIMKHDEAIVFVEVRYRKSQQYGGAAMSVTAAKQRKIALAALHYLQSNRCDNTPCRFDVLAFSERDQQWLQDAFHSPL